MLWLPQVAEWSEGQCLPACLPAFQNTSQAHHDNPEPYPRTDRLNKQQKTPHHGLLGRPVPTHNANRPPPRRLLFPALQTFTVNTVLLTQLHTKWSSEPGPNFLELTLILSGLNVSKLHISPSNKNQLSHLQEAREKRLGSIWSAS